MAFDELPRFDQEVVLQCVRAIADGDAITEAEFQTRLGITREILRGIISRWPKIDDRRSDSDEFLAVNNCLNEVCHGIRLTPEEWALRFTESRDTVLQTYRNWLRLSGSRGGIR